MLTMQRFFTEIGLGIEITARELRLGLLIGKGGAISLSASKTVPLPAGMVNETFASQNIKNFEGLTSILRSSLKESSTIPIRRAGLSLPDGIFRVQTFEFDELPANNRDRDRLVRWRLEKGAAFDTANTLLRYQVLPRQDRGSSVLACVAKQEVISQYEDLLAGMSLEPWAVVPSSFNALNFYATSLAMKNLPGYALAWVAEDSYTTIIVERGGPRFYRYKEIKAGAPEGVTGRLIRELDDTIHFYVHMDRQQQSAVDHLYLSGEPALIASLSESLKYETTLKIETLVPSLVLAEGADADPSLAAAFGAGGALC
jgi:Tfp pilus assembly PilM family ATPase